MSEHEDEHEDTGCWDELGDMAEALCRLARMNVHEQLCARLCSPLIAEINRLGTRLVIAATKKKATKKKATKKRTKKRLLKKRIQKRLLK